MLRTGVALAIACSVALAHAPALALDADDCESAANNLRNSASELQDAARRLDRAAGADVEYAESRVRSRASSVMSEADSVRSACNPAPRVSLPADQIYQLILVHLGIRFPNATDRNARVVKVKEQLMELARTHVRVAPADARMTFAVAELVYLSDD